MGECKTTSASMTMREAAVAVLEESGPLPPTAIMTKVLERGLWSGEGKTPEASLGALMALDIKGKKKDSQFVRVRPGVFGLRGQHQPTSPDDDGETSDLRVRAPFFNKYSSTRAVLSALEGTSKATVTGFHAALREHWGTPQENVDWSDPDSWIGERLSDADQVTFAQKIWEGSDKTANPRHIYGDWLLLQRTELVVDGSDGLLHSSETGKEFLSNTEGQTTAFLDEHEGLLKALSLVANNGPVAPKGIHAEWFEYLSKHSNFASDSTRKETLRRRLANLLERDLVSKNSGLYSATEAGLSWLEKHGDDSPGTEKEEMEIWTLIRAQEASARDTIRELLLNMDAFDFEHLVSRLLQEMNYENVEVTTRGGDGGVDVIGDIELGITSVKEVVQVKRHRRTIQRKDLDALRGSLYRFDAVRGTIITTSKFSKGTQEAAFARGAAPITLIDGEKLIDLLIQNGIGVRKRQVEILEVDPTAFSGNADE